MDATESLEEKVEAPAPKRPFLKAIAMMPLYIALSPFSTTIKDAFVNDDAGRHAMENILDYLSFPGYVAAAVVPAMQLGNFEPRQLAILGLAGAIYAGGETLWRKLHSGRSLEINDPEKFEKNKTPRGTLWGKVISKPVELPFMLFNHYRA